MKKYLLTALLWVFGLFGFVSAVDYTVVWTSDWYSPNTFDWVSFDSSSFRVVDYSCSNDYCWINFTSPYSCSLSYTPSDWLVYDMEYCWDEINLENLWWSRYAFLFGYWFLFRMVGYLL